MKKLVYITLLAIGLTTFTACGSSVMKSDNLDIEINLPDSKWSVTTDDDTSYIISKGNDMISYSRTDIPTDVPYVFPTTEDELLESLIPEVAEISEISDFIYGEEEDGSKYIYYIQKISQPDSITTIITKDTMSGLTRTLATATLIDASTEDISEISNEIKKL